jgi:hypothetical protein
MYNIETDGKVKMVSAEVIRENAIGPAIRLNGSKTLYRVAANCRGWVTAVSETGVIIQGWAGDFTAAELLPA